MKENTVSSYSVTDRWTLDLTEEAFITLREMIAIAVGDARLGLSEDAGSSPLYERFIAMQELVEFTG
jgi:hypothetical protein